MNCASRDSFLEGEGRARDRPKSREPAAELEVRLRLVRGRLRGAEELHVVGDHLVPGTRVVLGVGVLAVLEPPADGDLAALGEVLGAQLRLAVERGHVDKDGTLVLAGLPTARDREAQLAHLLGVASARLGVAGEAADQVDAVHVVLLCPRSRRAVGVTGRARNRRRTGGRRATPHGDARAQRAACATPPGADHAAPNGHTGPGPVRRPDERGAMSVALTRMAPIPAVSDSRARVLDSLG